MRTGANLQALRERKCYFDSGVSLYNWSLLATVGYVWWRLVRASCRWKRVTRVLQFQKVQAWNQRYFRVVLVALCDRQYKDSTCRKKLLSYLRIQSKSIRIAATVGKLEMTSTHRGGTHKKTECQLAYIELVCGKSTVVFNFFSKYIAHCKLVLKLFRLAKHRLRPTHFGGCNLLGRTWQSTATKRKACLPLREKEATESFPFLRLLRVSLTGYWWRQNDRVSV